MASSDARRRYFRRYISYLRARDQTTLSLGRRNQPRHWQSEPLPRKDSAWPSRGLKRELWKAFYDVVDPPYKTASLIGESVA